MSRSKKEQRPPGYEYWSKRPCSNAHGAEPGRFTKRRTHKLERVQNKKETRERNED